MLALWRHRQVLRMLVIRDLHRKYTRFRLGYLWSLLEPLGMSVVLWFVFSVLLGARSLGLQPYLLFLTVAILPWWWFTTGMNASTRTFRRIGGSLRISVLPTQVWVARAVLVSMVEFLASLPVLVVAMIATRTLPSVWIVLFPVAIALQFLLMYGLGLMVATGSALIPDLARIVRILTRALFYLSPVIYSISNIPEHLQTVAMLNPLVGVFGLYRIGFWPQEIESVAGYGLSIGISLVILAVGLLTFRRLEPRILKDA